MDPIPDSSSSSQSFYDAMQTVASGLPQRSPSQSSSQPLPILITSPSPHRPGGFRSLPSSPMPGRGPLPFSKVLPQSGVAMSLSPGKDLSSPGKMPRATYKRISSGPDPASQNSGSKLMNLRSSNSAMEEPKRGQEFYDLTSFVRRRN